MNEDGYSTKLYENINSRLEGLDIEIGYGDFTIWSADMLDG